MISCVVTENASSKTGCVIGMVTVLMVLTKQKQRAPHVPICFSARMAGAQTWNMFVMERITVKITATKVKSVSVSLRLKYFCNLVIQQSTGVNR